MKLSQLFIYPIKSLGGIALNEALVTDRGLEHDRRWLLVDENNDFLTQREHPQLALLQVAIEGENLRVWHKIKKIAPLSISLNQQFNNRIVEPSTIQQLLHVTVWDDTVQAQSVSNEADEWFTHVLGTKTKLVYMPDASRREVDKKYAINQEITSFSDGYPLLIIGQESLNYLNEQLEEKLPINRFRPNLVFTGGEPHEEDTWYEFSVGEVSFFGVKPCARCVMTTINQDTAEKGKEPLKTLVKYRQRNNKIYFGQNLLPNQLGKISVGDEITILSKNPQSEIVNPQSKE